MQNIWFTSDTHYHHKNIVRGTTAWKEFEEGSSHQSTRDFDTLEEHDDTLVENFNTLVKPNDILYHLGDWSFGGHEQIKKFRDRLNVKTIHLIEGNHDQHIFKKGSPYKDLFTSIQSVLQFSMRIDSQTSGKYGKTKFFLSHYSHQVWDQSHHGVIHLFGHSHGTLKGIGRSMDVGVDTHNLFPYSLDEVLYFMKDLKWEAVDHHNESTN